MQLDFLWHGCRTVGTCAVDWFNPKQKLVRSWAHRSKDFIFLARPGALLISLIGFSLSSSWRQWEQPGLYFSMWARPTPPTSTLEWVDGGLASLMQHFVASTVMVCADHGDCWGEDDLWGHSISYPAWLVVPLLLHF